MSRRTYDRQFKLEAVKLIENEQFSVAEVARELNIHPNSIYRWVGEYEAYGENAFPGHGSAIDNLQHEIRKLQKENADLRMELDLLKKFRAFLKKK